MLQFIRYFAILFLSPKISRSRLKSFAEDHILRLTANNPGGIFTSILTAVTTAYNAYFGDLSSETLNLTVQESKTIAMNESRVALEARLSDNNALVTYTYRNDESTYHLFYPNGMNEYLDASIDDLETISGRYKSVLASHSGDFSNDFVSEYNTIQQTFVDNRSAQTTAKANVSSERSDMATSKVTLANQLTVNLLTIATKYVGDESKAAVYFNQAIINAAFTESASKVENDINPRETQNDFDNTSGPEIKYKMSVEGPGTLYFGFGETAETLIDANTGKAVNETEDKTFTASEMGYTSEKLFLNVTNSEAVTLSYAIERV